MVANVGAEKVTKAHYNSLVTQANNTDTAVAGKAATSHTHPYADSTHTHSEFTHTHDYAATGHSHDLSGYSTTSHTHTHNHDTAYSATGHAHTGMVIGDGISTVRSLSQAAYDALATKDASTLYVIV